MSRSKAQEAACEKDSPRTAIISITDVNSSPNKLYASDWLIGVLELQLKRIERLSKRDIISCFRKVMTTLILFFDIKTAHDCLTAIVEELDERAAAMERGESPKRAWVE